MYFKNSRLFVYKNPYTEILILREAKDVIIELVLSNAEQSLIGGHQNELQTYER